MNVRVLRVAVFIGAVILFGSLTHGRALAIVEYCGATANLAPVGVPSDTPATMYALSLSANSARTVSGHVALQTDNGWFEVPFDGVNLTSRTRRYQGPSVVFTRTDFESPTLFATLPSAAIVRAAFVEDATVTNEHALGWDTQSHACVGYAYDPSHPRKNGPIGIVALDKDPAVTPPPPGTPLLHASIASAPGSTNCSQPFADAKVSEAMKPDFPLGYHVDQPYVSLIEIAVDATGKLGDAWVYAPSGVKAFDDAALRAARQSTYVAPRSFCRDVPGVYIFRAVFHPG